MKKLSIYLLPFCIIIFLFGCTTHLTKSQAEQLIKDYYAKEETRDGGSHIYLKTVEILEYNNSEIGVAKAKVVINGTASPNQVPGAAPDRPIVDTFYWKFTKEKGEWKTNYDSKPF